MQSHARFSIPFHRFNPYHCPQAMEENIGHFLRLIKDFKEGLTVLYNGPRCGASAPDHLHFQVIPSGPDAHGKRNKERGKTSGGCCGRRGLLIYA